MQIVVCTTHRLSISEIWRHCVNVPVGWLYLGGNLKKLQEIQKILGQNNQISIAHLLQEIAANKRREYIDYIGKISQQNNNLKWWANLLAEKSPYISQTFLNICYLFTIKQIVQKFHFTTPQKIIIVTESRYLFACIKKNQKMLFFDGDEIVYLDSLLNKSYFQCLRIYEVIICRLWFIFSNIYRIVLCKFLLAEQKKQIISTNKPLIFIFTWCHDQDIINNDYKDAYWGRFFQFLQSQKKYAFFIPLILKRTSSYKLIKIIKQRRLPQVLIYQFLCITDIFKLFFYSFQPPLSLQTPNFQGFNVLDLIKDDLRADWNKNRYSQNLLIWHFVSRLNKYKVNLDRIIYLYENLPWEKVLCLAVKHFFPTAKLIAYQHASIPKMFLPVFFSKFEKEILPMPDKIITSGAIFYKVFLLEGYPTMQLISGGSLRYNDQYKNYLHENKVKQQILITTATGQCEAVELINTSYRAFKNQTQFDVIIKCHPDMPFKNLMSYLCFGKLPVHFQLSTEPINKLLIYTDLLIFTSSTTAIEALLTKTPILCFCSNYTINLNPLLQSNQSCPIVYDEYELLEKTNALLTKDKQELEPMLRMEQQIAKEYFAEMTECNLNAFLIN